MFAWTLAFTLNLVVMVNAVTIQISESYSWQIKFG
ncbi:hypothetical protein MTO96_042483, partial [Rhipicephalus appendiculatus]